MKKIFYLILVIMLILASSCSRHSDSNGEFTLSGKLINNSGYDIQYVAVVSISDNFNVFYSKINDEGNFSIKVNRSGNYIVKLLNSYGITKSILSFGGENKEIVSLYSDVSFGDITLSNSSPSITLSNFQGTSLSESTDKKNEVINYNLKSLLKNILNESGKGYTIDNSDNTTSLYLTLNESSNIKESLELLISSTYNENGELNFENAISLSIIRKVKNTNTKLATIYTNSTYLSGDSTDSTAQYIEENVYITELLCNSLNCTKLKTDFQEIITKLNNNTSVETCDYSDMISTSLQNGLSIIRGNVKSLEITSPGTSLFDLGESINYDGLKVSATYKNGNKIEIDNSSLTITTDYNSSTNGAYTVTITYEGITITYSVTVFGGPVPSGYSVSIDQSKIDPSNQNALSFTFAGAEVGTTYYYSIDDTNGSTSPITGNGTISTATDQISGINVSSLSDGVLTLTVYLKNSFGNKGSNTSATVTKDVTAPAISSITPSKDSTGIVINANIVLKFNESLDTSISTWSLSLGTGSANFTESNSAIAFSTTTYTNDTVTLDPDSSFVGETLYGNISISGFKDTTGNSMSTYTDASYNFTTGDGTAPTVSSVSSSTVNGTYKIGDSIDITVAFSENVNVTGTPTLTLETGATDRTINYASGSGTSTLTFTYTVLSGDESSDLDYKATTALALNSGTIRDASSNNAVLTLPTPGAANSLGANKALVIDGIAPSAYTVTIASPINASNKTNFTFTFSSAETGAAYNYTIDDTNGSTSAITGSGTIATATDSISSIDVSGLDDDTLSLTVYLVDAAGNKGGDETDTVSKDTVIPSISSVNSSTSNGTYKAGDIINITVNFSEAVTVTGTPTLTLETGATDRTINYSSGSGTAALTFTYTVQSGDVSSDLDYVATTSLALNGGTIKDGGNNAAVLTLPTPGAANSLGANKALVVDAAAPSGYTVSIDQASIDASNQSALSFTFAGAEVGTTYYYSIDDTNGATSAVTSNGTITSATQTIDTINVSSLSDDTLTLTVYLVDTAGNKGDDETDTVAKDSVDPTVSSVSSSTANGTYKIGDIINIMVNFSEAITITGTPTLTLETGTTDRTINYASGSGTAALTFTYTVQSGDVSSDLDYVATTALALNGGTIKDGGNNAAVLTLPTPGAANSLGTNKALVIDGISPTVSSVNSSTANGTYKAGDTINITVNFSEAVTVTGTPTLTLETGATDRTINYSSGSGTSALTFTYTVQTGDVSSDLDYVVTSPLSGTIKDAAGNSAVLTLPTPGTANSLGANKALVVDAAAPSGYTVSIDQSYINASNKTALSFTFASAEAEATYYYSINDTNGSTSAITGSGTIATATDSISSIDVSGLDDDTLSLTVYLVDAAGNKGGDETDTVVKDITAPTVSSVNSPTDNSTSVSISTDIVIQFNESLDNSVTTGWAISCSTGSFSFSNTNANITYSTTTKTNDTVTINPNSDLSNETTYGNLTISGFKDLAGNTMNSYNNSTYDFATVSGVTAPTDYVLYLSFDGDTTDSGPTHYTVTTYNNTGSISPILTTDRFGTSNKAYEFAGGNNDFFNITSFSKSSTNSTWAFWMKLDSSWNAGNNSLTTGIMNFTSNKTPFINIYPIGVANGELCYNSSSSSNFYEVANGTSINDTWVYVAITRSGNNVTVYVNGIIQSESASGGVLTSEATSGELYIGCGWNIGSEVWKGALDEFMVFDRALTDTEVNQLYNSQKP